MTRPRPARLSRRQFLALSAAAATVAAAPAAAQPARRTFVSAKTTEAPSLDPIMEQALSRQRLDPLFYNRLVEWGHDGKLEPALAESWTTSGDGRTWTFKLRRGVKFHAKAPVNGRELTADDVRYTFERILTEAGSANVSMYRSIAKVEAVEEIGRASCRERVSRCV